MTGKLIFGFSILFLTLVTVAKLMIIAMTVIVGVTVFLRYVVGQGIRWSAEVAQVLQVWFTFIAMALGVRKGMHISINIMPEKLSPWISVALAKLQYLAVGVVGYVMLVYGYGLVQSTMRSVLPATRMPSGYLYLVIPVCGFLLIVESLTDLFGIDRRDGWMSNYLGEDEEDLEDVMEHGMNVAADLFDQDTRAEETKRG
ncbi:MAG: TRAP transporter small permease [Spirochaetaceae bacterium]